jgi:hypothetical protein
MRTMKIDGLDVYVTALPPIDIWGGVQTLQQAREACEGEDAASLQRLLDVLRCAVELHASDLEDGEPRWREGEPYRCGWSLGEGMLIPWVGRKLENNGTVVVASGRGGVIRQ